MRQRPCGITALGLIYLFLGALSLLWSLIVFGFGSVSWLTGSLFGADAMASSGGANAWAGFLGLAAAFIQVVAAIGLLMLKRWAWVLAIIAVGVTVIQGMVGIFSGGLMAFCCGGFGVLLPIGILFYLFLPGVRAAFRRGGAPAASEVYLSSETYYTTYPAPPAPQPPAPPEPPTLSPPPDA